MTARVFDRASPVTVSPVITALATSALKSNASTSGNASTSNNELTVDALVEARAALSRSNIYVLRKLSVERESDGLVLRGSVESFYHKQLAQELVRAAVDGVKVSNLLAVVYTHKPDFIVESR